MTLDHDEHAGHGCLQDPAAAAQPHGDPTGQGNPMEADGEPLTRGTLLTDQAQLAALPPRCVVRAADGRPFQWSVLSVPALVLWVDGDTLALPGDASVEAQR